MIPSSETIKGAMFVAVGIVIYYLAVKPMVDKVI